MKFWRELKSDVQSVFERDPAATGLLEVLLCTPGLHALWAHRLLHPLYRRGWRLVPRFGSQVVRFLTGIEIHPGAKIGRGFFIDHGSGVVIGETTEIGDDVTLYQGVTLGGTGNETGKRHPTIESGVVIGTGAKVLGSLTVGANSRIGGNSVVVKPVPPNCTVVGIPGRVVAHNGQRTAGATLDHGMLPDPVKVKLDELQQAMRDAERRCTAPDCPQALPAAEVPA